MSDHQRYQPCAAAITRPSGDEKRVRESELAARYRTIGIAAVAAAAGAGAQARKVAAR